jgi:sulfur relay (sulfurtransferase) DsrC/TusE family protein
MILNIIMGNTPSMPCSFLIQRIITPDIYIGIKSGGKQAFKWKDRCYELQNCQEYDEKIIFQFENQYFLELSKGFGDIIHYTITTPDEKHIGQISDTIRKMHKKISMNSDELDKIYKLFQS